MNFEISIEKLKSLIQKLIDSELYSIKEESQEWGLGEMGELEVLDSVEKIEISNIVTVNSIKVYINIYSYSIRYDKSDYQDLRAELQYRIEDWFPNIELFIDEIIT